MGIRASLGTDAELLDKYVNSSFDIIRKAVDNLETIELFGSIDPDSEMVKFLQEILNNIDNISGVINSAELIRTASRDIEKGNYFGNRKLDIDIALNKVGIEDTTTYEAAQTIWQDTTNTVYYNKATVTFVYGVVIEVPFINDDGQSIQVSTHGSIVDQLMDNVSFTNKLEDTTIIEEVGGRTGTLIRVVDVTGTNSNIERIQLHVTTGGFVNASPLYYWALTTSALQTLSQRIGDIIALGNNIQQIILLANNIEQMLEVQNVLTELLAIHTELAKLIRLHTSIVHLDRLYTSINKLDRLFISISELDRLNTSIIKLDRLYNSIGSLDRIHLSITGIDAIYDKLTELDRVHLSIDNIDRLHTSIVEIDRLYTSIVAIDSLYANIALLDTLGTELTKLIDIYNNLTAINAVNDVLPEINAVHNNLAYIELVVNNLTDIQNAEENAQLAIDAAATATTQAGIATTQANIAIAEVDKIEALTATAQTLVAGSSASASYSSGTGVLTLGIPQGIKGDKGDPFTVSAMGNFADRSTYDAQPLGFSFLAFDTGTLYFKLSNTSGDWSGGVPFGKGDTGDTGVSVTSIVFTSTTDISGLAAQSGATDTYTVNFSDASTSTFTVYNGADSALLTVAGRVGDVVLVEADITDLDKYSTDEVDSLIIQAKDESLAMSIVFGG
jgi:hypothetical protein